MTLGTLSQLGTPLATINSQLLTCTALQAVWDAGSISSRISCTETMHGTLSGRRSQDAVYDGQSQDTGKP
jgi:hypothetical protein